jgi:hypothetical protein
MKDEGLATTERLARALEALNDLNVAEMVVKARDGYYDDYKSPLDFPIRRLVHDLEAAGHPEMAERVKDGEFDATEAEALEWSRTEEALKALGELLVERGARQGHKSRPAKTS